MKNKTKSILTALAFCAVSGGLLAFNAYAVPNIATLTQSEPLLNSRLQHRQRKRSLQ